MTDTLRELLKKADADIAPLPHWGPHIKPPLGGMTGSKAHTNERLAAYLWNHAEAIADLIDAAEKCREYTPSLAPALAKFHPEEPRS